MKSRYTKTRILISLLLVVSSLALSSVTTAETLQQEELEANTTEALSLESLTGLYHQRISRLELEIRNESERRTTILAQLDKVIGELSEIDTQGDVVVGTSPSFSDSLEQINTEISKLERDIDFDNNLLDQLQTTLDRQPELSIWQAALGSPDIKMRQQLLATQSYLVHTTRKHKDQLLSKRSLLSKRYQSIMDYNEGIENSISELQTRFENTLNRRHHLEYQLTEISSQIVVRQDRISTLTERSQQMQSDPGSIQFDKLARRLADPVDGQVIRAFSEPKAKGLLKWKGLLVQAPLGLPFTAVADGLVVFADELQGLGNVAIIDHGHGYMTLYGMAELLVVEQDQFLLAGDPVGTVGEATSADASALYFEVRHNAEALDPQSWLQMNRITQK